MKNNNIASTSLKLFESSKWRVRVVMRDDEPWFVAKDVCECLCLSDTAKSCERLDEDEKGTNAIRTPGGYQDMIIISEPGLYSLVLRSNKPDSKEFKRWVTHEVIPSIRKTGSYSTQSPMTDEEILSSALLIANRNLALREERIKALEVERDEAIRTKAMIGSKREATAMATASQKSKECEKLREQIGDSKTYKAIKAIPWLSNYFDTSNRGHALALAAALKKIEANMPPEYKHKRIEDSEWGTIKIYHVAVIEQLYNNVKADDNFMHKYRKTTN